MVSLIYVLRGTRWRDAIETGIALAVAAVPEGLPVIATIAMAVGVWRMARRHAIVRRLPVVETLGAATVICTDKTGTVTTGEMSATSLWIAERDYDISGVGYETSGEIRSNGRSLDLETDGVVPLALRIAALANRGEIAYVDGRPRAHGDPTDVALLVAAVKGKVGRDEWRARWPEIAEIPFSSQRKFMATVPSIARRRHDHVGEGRTGDLALPQHKRRHARGRVSLMPNSAQRSKMQTCDWLLGVCASWRWRTRYTQRRATFATVALGIRRGRRNRAS